MPSVTEILDIIETRLKNISETNGYYVTPKCIKRGSLEPFKGYDLPAINYWPNELRVLDGKYNHDSMELSVSVEAHTLTRDLPFSDAADELAADIAAGLDRKTSAPRKDDVPDYHLGSAVSSLKISGYQYQIGTGQTPWCGVLVSISIRFRNNHSNDLETFRR